MLFPFHPNPEEKLKIAAYEADLLGEIIYWDPKDKIYRRTLRREEEFVLPANSIAFVSIEPRLRLPNYIALRFNLKIRHVHKGLLLGTGPLVDPGFSGKLLIPLHNLTTNPYTFRGGDGLIWFEFTKISPHEDWSWLRKARPLGRFGQLGEKPPASEMDPVEYLKRAAGDHSIRSSIPGEAEKARVLAERAQGQVQRFSRIVYGLGIASFIALILAIVFGVFPIYSLVEESTSFVAGMSRDNLTEMKRAQRELEVRVKALEEKIERLPTAIPTSRSTPSLVHPQTVHPPHT